MRDKREEVSGAFKVEVVGPLKNLGGGRSGVKGIIYRDAWTADPKMFGLPNRDAFREDRNMFGDGLICGRGTVSQQEINLEMVLVGEKSVEKAFVTDKKQPPGRGALEENLDTRWASKTCSIKLSSSLDPNLRFLYGSRTSGTRLW